MLLLPVEEEVMLEMARDGEEEDGQADREQWIRDRSVLETIFEELFGDTRNGDGSLRSGRFKIKSTVDEETVVGSLGYSLGWCELGLTRADHGWLDH